MTSREFPSVWVVAFEKHRIAGDQKIVFGDKARAEIEESDAGGVVFEVCVDAKGTVSSIVPRMVAAHGPTANALEAAAKTWKFDPFIVRGKPVTACALENQKL